MQEIILQEEYITLGQLLKVAGIVPSGGEAKLFLMETSVTINGMHDNRRGRKLRAGDIVIVEKHPPIRLVSSDERPSPQANARIRLG